jgi:hypothetical protein
MVAADTLAVPNLEVVVAVVGSAAIAAAVVPLVVPAMVGTTLEPPLSARTRTTETLRIAVRYACLAQQESYE